MARVTRWVVMVSSTSAWKPSFSKQGGDGQQAAVGSQVLAAEVIGRESPDFIGLRGRHGWALFDGPSGAMLFSIGNHLDDLLGMGWRS